MCVCTYVFVCVDEGILFNITPSPGATTCIGVAESDMRYVVNALNGHLFDRTDEFAIYEELVRTELYEGQYPVRV